jgi:lysozyme
MFEINYKIKYVFMLKPLKISPKGVNLIKNFEGLRLQSYLCVGNVWSIGWGTTEINGVKVKERDVINLDYAEQLLLFDIKRFEELVNRRINICLTQNQFDALVCHSYNTGGSDTLFDLINSGSSNKKIREWFEGTYISANGKVLKGLIDRRKKEANLFFS